jgi:hypothetical protein
MSVSKEDRRKCEEGQNDRRLPFLERNIKDIRKGPFG